MRQQGIRRRDHTRRTPPGMAAWWSRRWVSGRLGSAHGTTCLPARRPASRRAGLRALGLIPARSMCVKLSGSRSRVSARRCRYFTTVRR